MVNRDDEAGERPLIKLHVDYDGFPDARETGRILDRMSNAFATHLRASSPIEGGRLLVEHIEISSLTAYLRDILELGSAAITLVEHRAMLVEFVGAVGNALTALQSGGGVAPSLRTLLAALAAPVDRGRASSTTVSVTGDNNVVVIINGEINDALQPLLRGPVDERLETLPALPRSIARASPATSITSQGVRRIVSQTALAQDRPRDATLKRIDKEWFARPLAMQGALLPAALTREHIEQLRQGGSFLALGDIVTSGGMPVRFVVENLKRRSRPRRRPKKLGPHSAAGG